MNYHCDSRTGIPGGRLFCLFDRRAKMATQACRDQRELRAAPVAPPDRTLRRATVALCHDHTRATTSTTSATAICRCSRSSVWWQRTTPSRSRTAHRVAGIMGNPAVEWVLTSPVRTHTTITPTTTDRRCPVAAAMRIHTCRHTPKTLGPEDGSAEHTPSPLQTQH